MVLKYRTECRYPADGKQGVYGQEQWHFIDGIIGASVYYDMENEATIAALEFDSRESMQVALYDAAYLLNENGKTIEKIRCYRNKHEERSCSRCIHSHKVDDITYECDAVEYDIYNKTCFVAKKEE